MSNDIEPTKFYLPCCRVPGCDGILSIEINKNYTINIKCDKSKEHNQKNINFRKFYNLYFKEKKYNICFNCNSNLEGENTFKCKECNKIYCSFCYINDKHIKNDLNNLFIIKKKCLIHNKDLIHYCINCNKYLCSFCIKDDNISNYHQDHDIKCLLDYILKENDITYLRCKIKALSLKNEEIIKSLDEWKSKIFNKIEEFKKDLKFEEDIIKKIISNYNK